MAPVTPAPGRAPLPGEQRLRVVAVLEVCEDLAELLVLGIRQPARST